MTFLADRKNARFPGFRYDDRKASVPDWRTLASSLIATVVASPFDPSTVFYPELNTYCCERNLKRLAYFGRTASFSIRLGVHVDIAARCARVIWATQQATAARIWAVLIMYGVLPDTRIWPPDGPDRTEVHVLF